MANCSKCGESLIGSGKFCAACGAPVVAVLPLEPVGAPSPRKAAGPKGTELMSSPAPTPSRPPPPPPLAARASASAPPPPARAPSAPVVDPFGTTVGREGSYGPPPPAPPLEPTNVSPLAASMVQPQYAPPPAPQYAPAPQYGAAPQAPPPAPHYAPAPQYGAAQPPPQYPLPQPPQFGAGARVLVQWADGNRYPAMVQQSAGAQCLVVFPNGQQQWVDAQYLSFG